MKNVIAGLIGISIFGTSIASPYSDNFKMLLEEAKEPINVNKIYGITQGDVSVTSVKKITDKEDIINSFSKILRKKIKYFKAKDLTIPEFVSHISSILGIEIELKNYDKEDKISFEGKGKLRDILNIVLTPLGYSYIDKGGKLVIEKYITKTYKIHPPSGTFKWGFNDSSASSSTTGFQGGVNFEQVVRNNVRAFLTSKSSKFVYEPMTGILTIYATRNEIENIENFLNSLNETITKTIKLRLDVIAVQLSDKFSTGIDFNLLKGDFRLSYANPVSNGISMGLVGTLGSGFISALQEFGTAKIVESQEFDAMNGFPIVLNNLREISYLKETNVGYITNSTGTTSIPSLQIKQGKVSEGSNFILIPKKIGFNQIGINVLYEKNQLNDLNEKSFVIQGQTTTIQLPDVSTEKLNIYSKLKKGQELILVSSITDLKRNKSSGIPFLSRLNILKYLFGKQYKEKGKYQFIVRITYVK